MAENPAITLNELPELRRKTEAVATLLRAQVSRHLETLQPLFAPERFFGKYAGGKGEGAAVERAYAELQQAHRGFTTRPYDLPQNFDPHWLTLVGNRLVLHPWEYIHEAKSQQETKTISMTAPLQWIVSFASNYSFGQMRQALTGQAAPENVRQYVVNALVLQQVVTKSPGITALLADLRYELKIVTAPDLKNLPLVTIRSAIPSFCPPDDLILAAAAFSGISAFIELIDTAGIQTVKDPTAAQIEAILK